MLPKHIFCQCMKPWKLCVNKQKSYQVDTRDLILTHNLKPYLNVGKGVYIDNPSYNITYDFVNMRPSQTTFDCRFSKYPSN